MNNPNHVQYGHYTDVYYPESNLKKPSPSDKQFQGQMLKTVRDALWKLYKTFFDTRSPSSHLTQHVAEFVGQKNYTDLRSVEAIIKDLIIASPNFTKGTTRLYDENTWQVSILPTKKAANSKNETKKNTVSGRYLPYSKSLILLSALQNNTAVNAHKGQIQSGQNVNQMLQYPTNGGVTKTTNNNTYPTPNNNNNIIRGKLYQLKAPALDENSLQRMKDLALITFKNLAPDCDDATNKAFNTSINYFLQTLLKETTSSPQPPQIQIPVQQPLPTPVLVQVKQEPVHEQHEEDKKEGILDESIDLNDESHTNGADDTETDEPASVLIPADETKPAPPLVAVLECLAKYFLRHTSTSNKIEDILMDMEEAYWYYIDIYRTVWPELVSVSFEQFTQQMLQNVSFLAAYHFAVINSSDYALVLENFKEYKAQLETCGAILVNPTLEKVLLVTSWYGKTSWMFPSGKMKRGEDRAACAIREAKEETGYDITGQIQPNDCLTVQSGPRTRTLFIVQNVPFNYPFKPQTRKEIKNIEWHHIADLPVTFAEAQKRKMSYHQIVPFVRGLKLWLTARRIEIAKGLIRKQIGLA